MTISSPHTDAIPSEPPFCDMRLGVDLVWTPRLQKSYQRFGNAFFQKLLTPSEMQYCQATPKTAIFLRRAAGKIAFKEATAKALGTGLNGLGWGAGVSWQEIESHAQTQSPPALQLHGKALDRANQLQIRGWRLSLSHDGDYAMATVLGLI